MHAQRGVGIAGYRGGHPGRGLQVGAVAGEGLGQLGLLGGGKAGVHRAFGSHLGVHQLILVGHRHVLPGAHGECPGHQRGHPGQDHVVRRDPAAAEPGDQRGVGDQPVNRAKHGRTQPAPGHVTVPVRPACRERRLPDRMTRLMLLLAHWTDYPPAE